MLRRQMTLATRSSLPFAACRLGSRPADTGARDLGPANGGVALTLDTLPAVAAQVADVAGEHDAAGLPHFREIRSRC
jgi:hypothetical protein